MVKELRSMLKVWKACLLGVEYKADRNKSRKNGFLITVAKCLTETTFKAKHLHLLFQQVQCVVTWLHGLEQNNVGREVCGKAVHLHKDRMQRERKGQERDASKTLPPMTSPPGRLSCSKVLRASPK